MSRAGAAAPTLRTEIVTGGAGFIGYNLMHFLIERGDRVVGYDNFFSGNQENAARYEKRFGNAFGVVNHLAPAPKHKRLWDGDIFQFIAEPAKAANVLGCRAGIGLEAGLTPVHADQNGLSFPESPKRGPKER